MLTTSSNRTRDSDGKPYGFTLLEMLVVVTIMSVSIMIVVGYNRESRGLRANAAAMDLGADLRALRQSAIAIHDTASLTLNAGGYVLRPGEVMRRLAPGLSIDLIPHGHMELFGRSNPDMRCFADGSCTGGVFVVQAGTVKFWVRMNWLDGSVVVHGA